MCTYQLSLSLSNQIYITHIYNLINEVLMKLQKCSMNILTPCIYIFGAVVKDPICSSNHEQLVSESRGTGSGSTHSATHSGVGEWEIALEFGMRGMRRMERAPNSVSVCVSPTRT